MNFNQSEIYEILQESRGDEMENLTSLYSLMDDNRNLDDFIKDEYYEHYESRITPEEMAANYLLEKEELCLDDVETFAAANKLIDSNESVNLKFHELYADTMDWDDYRMVLDTYNKYMDNLQSDGLLHQLQVNNYGYF